MDTLLKGVQLKKTDTIDKSSPNVQLTLEQFNKNKEKANATNVDKWYEGLKDELISSKLFPLSVVQAKALYHHYECKKMKKVLLLFSSFMITI